MGYGKACASCGARLQAGQGFCTSCGVAVAAEHPVQTTDRGGFPWLVVASVGGVAAGALIGIGIFLASSGQDDGVAAVSASASPGASGKRSPSPTQTPTVAPTATVQTTVTATATQTVTAPPPAPLPVYSTPAPGYTDFSGDWSGTTSDGTNTYSVVLDLSQTGSGAVSGTMTSINSSNGATGKWYVQGQIGGDSVTLSPTGWISKPNSTWQMDTVYLTKSGGSLSAKFQDPDPGGIWGTATLS